MKTLKPITIALFLLVQCLSFGQVNKLELIKNKFNPLLKEQHQGVAILIKKANKREILSLGNFKLNEKHVFNIGSATKTFTAILILQEIEKGNLKLTDTIGHYLTAIKNVNASLTIEQLLTHQSGLDEVIGRNIETIFYAKNDSLYNQNLLNLIEKPNLEKVGTFDYCNTNYFLLGKIIEKVTDKNYFDLLRERIINPLKMLNTYPYVHKNLPNLATPYHKEKEVTSYLDYRFYANIAYSAGSIASTLTDMELFYTALFETELLLKKDTVKLMMMSGSEWYGLGLQKTNKDGKDYFKHGGNNIGYSFRNAYNPETKDLFLMFTNSFRIPFKNAIYNDLFAYLNNNNIETLEAITISDFEVITGKYLLKEANLTLEIKIENNKMFLISEAQGVKSELKQKDNNALIDTSVGAVLTKIKGTNNSLTFSQNGFTTTINKINLKK